MRKKPYFEREKWTFEKEIKIFLENRDFSEKKDIFEGKNHSFVGKRTFFRENRYF